MAERDMNAFVAITDRDWFDFLAARGDVDEVNFWQPSAGGGRFRALGRGEPFLFKLRAPVNAIVGGGFFERHVPLSFSFAWRAFGPKNGAPTQQAFWDRIARLRREPLSPWDDPDIGCILLVEPFFWPEELWIPQPGDWHRNIQRGRTYDLRTDPGRSLWRAVADRLQAATSLPTDTDQSEIPGGWTDAVATRRRMGQGTFQAVVLDAYGRQCAITSEKAVPALDAAHIRPFADNPIHELHNGLLLRSDVHRLFDAGYITVTPGYQVEASQRMREDFNDGETYLRLHGTAVQVPRRAEERPSAAALMWHNENRFRG
jgi:putative restriction endonuclease